MIPIVLLALLCGCSGGGDAPPTSVDSFKLPVEDKVRFDGLPIGKWMIAPDLSPAAWIGESDRGRRFREPINVLVEDRVSTTAEEAKRRFVGAAARAGYPERSGHSSGYMGWLDGHLYGQLPEKRDHAFSDGPFEFANNHGRAFGPLARNGAHYFIASFSREKVDPVSKIKHQYASFNQARDHFTQSLDRSGSYRIAAFEHLGNAVLGDPGLTTGDHDGVAVRLVAEE